MSRASTTSLALLVLPLLIACNSAPTDQAPPDALPNLLVKSAADASIRWQPAEGWLLGTPQLFGDLDGNGYDDLLIWAVPVDGSTGKTLFVKGPLRRSLTLPGDEAGSILGGVEAVGDANQDSIPDFDTTNGDQHSLVLGPIEKDMDILDGTLVEEPLRDLNGDGLFDLRTMRSDPIRTEILWGPSSRWHDGAPPDLVIQPICPGIQHPGTPTTLPDLTGDGQRELLTLGGDQNGSCDTLVTTLPTDGWIVPSASDGAVDGYSMTAFKVVPDQDGDGLPDLISGLTVLGSPISFGQGGVVKGTWTFTYSELLNLYPMPFDFDDDGIADLFGYDATLVDDYSVVQSGGADMVSDELWVLIPGGTTGTEITYDTAFDLAGGSLHGVLVEDGVATFLIHSEAGDIALLDVSEKAVQVEGPIH